jgi:hypothetical protein
MQRGNQPHEGGDSMRRKAFLSAFVFVTALLISCQAFSLELPWQISAFFVQERFFEDSSKNITRVYFEIKDAAGTVYSQSDLLASCQLLEPGSVTPLVITPTYIPFREIDGGYDGPTGRWSYGAEYTGSGYSFALPAGSFKAGTYKLDIIFDTFPLTKDFYSTGTVTLPIISSKKLKPKFDKAGNLYAEWPVPIELYLSNPTLSTSSRIDIEVRQGSNYIGTLITRVPTHMGRVFFPANVINTIRSWGGDTYLIRAQMRANDNSTRTLSNWMPLKFPKASN